MSKHKVDQISKATGASPAIFTLPAADGTSGQLMKTAGSGQLGWVTDGVGDGTVTVAKLSTSATEADNVKQRVCKAWMRFNTSGGTPAILDDFNFSSITDEATGHFTVNFTTAMGNANYAALVTTRHADGVTMAVCPTIDNRTTTGYKIWTVTAAAVAYDPVTDGVSTVVFGDSA